MTRAQMMAVATTSRDMLFYDIAANRFRCVTKVTGLQSCPTTLHFWSPLTMSRVDGPEDNLCLIWGNANGGVGALCFSANPDTTAINPKQTQPHSRRIPFAEILSGGHPKIKGYILNGIHKDLVHQVTYLHHTKCFISCSRDTESAMFMGDFELKMHKCYFKVQNGVFSFDYVPSLNIIVSGGYDAIVRIWNPYVPSKPIIVLQGHKSPITQVKVNLSRETIISIADNKEIRIFDLNTQTCIQTFYRKMFPGMGPRPFTGLFFNERRQALILGTTRLLSLEHCEEDLRTRKTISHLRPVTTVLYNPLFQQVVSAGSCSTVCVWHVFSGDKVSQSLENELRKCYHFRKPYQNDDISVISHEIYSQFDGLVQETRNSSALSMDVRLSCTNPSSMLPRCFRQIFFALQWRLNERDGVSNHRRLDCLLNRLFGRRSKKTSKLRVTGLCEGNPPVTGGFPSQRASNAENFSIWWRHHVESLVGGGKGPFFLNIQYIYHSCWWHGDAKRQGIRSLGFDYSSQYFPVSEPGGLMLWLHAFSCTQLNDICGCF